MSGERRQLSLLDTLRHGISNQLCDSRAALTATEELSSTIVAWFALPIRQGQIIAAYVVAIEKKKPCVCFTTPLELDSTRFHFALSD